MVAELWMDNYRGVLTAQSKYTMESSGLYHQSIKYCALQFFCTSVTLNMRLLVSCFETERYTQEKHQIKSFDLQEIYEFDFSFFVVSRFVPKLRKFKKIGARNT